MKKSVERKQPQYEHIIPYRNAFYNIYLVGNNVAELKNYL